VKVVFKINIPETHNKLIYLDENEMFIEERDKKIIIKTSYEDRFNSLISLFALKNNLEERKDNNYLYKIMFEDNGIEKIYSYEQEPSNFNIMMGYFVRLVGDFI